MLLEFTVNPLWLSVGKSRSNEPPYFAFLASLADEIFVLVRVCMHIRIRSGVAGASSAGKARPGARLAIAWLMLAISVHSAINQAISSLAPGRALPALDAPATPERILMCIQSLKSTKNSSAKDAKNAK